MYIVHFTQPIVCLFVCGGSLTSGQLVKGSFQTDSANRAGSGREGGVVV